MESCSSFNNSGLGEFVIGDAEKWENAAVHVCTVVQYCAGGNKGFYCFAGRHSKVTGKRFK